jgi:hypothetical protein
MLWEAAAAAAVGLLALWIVLAPLGSGGSLSRRDDVEPDDPEETPRGVALAALKDIEFDRATGKLAEADYADLKARYTAAAVAAMREEEAARRPDDVETLIAARVRALRGAAAACVVCGPRPEPDALFCSTCGRSLGPIRQSPSLNPTDTPALGIDRTS